MKKKNLRTQRVQTQMHSALKSTCTLGCCPQTKALLEDLQKADINASQTIPLKINGRGATHSIHEARISCTQTKQGHNNKK